MSTVQIDKYVIERAIEAMDAALLGGSFEDADLRGDLESSVDDLEASIAASQAVEPEPVAWLDIEKLAVGGMAYATAQKTTQQQTPLGIHPAPVKPLSDEQRGDLVMEHLGVGALMGDKMSIYDAFMLGITAGEAAHGIGRQS